PRSFERRGMRNGTLNVMPPQSPVEADRLAVSKKEIRDRVGKTSVPHVGDERMRMLNLVEWRGCAVEIDLSVPSRKSRAVQRVRMLVGNERRRQPWRKIPTASD